MKSLTRTFPFSPALTRLFFVAAIACCLFSFAIPRAQAAQLTEPQIEAILNLLVSFDVSQTTIDSVSVILHNTTPTTPDSSGLMVTGGQQPANTLAPQGAIVPFTNFTLTNNGTGPVAVNSVVVQASGARWSNSQAFTQVYISNENGDSVGGAEKADRSGTTLFDSNLQVYIPVTLSVEPGQSRTLKIMGAMSADLSAYAGQTISLSLADINTSGRVSGVLPITGAQHTINTSLNACFPPQTAVYGYKCWSAPAAASAGVLTVSTDASSPAYQIAAGGTSGVTLGAFRLRATGEDITLNKLGLLLSSGNPSDLKQVYLYNGSSLLGTAVFVGEVTTATSSLVTPLKLSKDTDARITVRGDISEIGVSQAGIPGDLVQVNALNYQATGQNSGLTLSGGASTNVAGVRIFRSYPAVAPVSLPNDGLADSRLLRFSIKANPSGSISIGKLSFKWSSTNTSGPVALDLYAYTDSSFSNPIPGGPHIEGASQSSGAFVVAPPAPLQIPAGATYYFEARGNISSLNNGATFTTKLLADIANAAQLQSGAVLREKDVYFVWSPNDTASAQFSDNDWTNGYQLPGLGSGISQTRTGSPTAAPALSATLTSNGSTRNTFNVGDVVTHVWFSTGAVSARSYYTVDSDDACGNKAGVENPWAASSLSGTSVAGPAPCQAGHTYTITYTVTAADGRTASATVVNTVRAATVTSAGSPNYVSMAASAVMAPFGILVDSLTELFVYAGIGQ